VVYHTAYHKCAETEYQIMAVVILNVSHVRMQAVCMMYMTEHWMMTSVIAIPIFGAEEKMHEIQKIVFATSVEASL
jgi:hypothetical protein